MLASVPVDSYFSDVSPGVILAGLIFLGLPTIIGSINGLLSIFAHFKKTPPDHATYATKSELTKVEETLAHSVEALEGRITAELATGQTLFNSIQKQLQTIGEQTAEVRGFVRALADAKKPR